MQRLAVLLGQHPPAVTPPPPPAASVTKGRQRPAALYLELRRHRGAQLGPARLYRAAAPLRPSRRGRQVRGAELGCRVGRGLGTELAGVQRWLAVAEVQSQRCMRCSKRPCLSRFCKQHNACKPVLHGRSD